MRLRILGIVIASFVMLAQASPPASVAPAKPSPAAPPAPKVVRVPPDEVVAILGQPIAGPDGKTIGRLIDVLVNEDGKPAAAVIDVGGFMGVGARKIAVRWAALHFAPGATKQPITLDWTVDQIKAAPEYGTARPAPVVVEAPKPSQSSPPAAQSHPVTEAGASTQAAAPSQTNPATPAPGNPTATNSTAGAATSPSPPNKPDPR